MNKKIVLVVASVLLFIVFIAALIGVINNDGDLSAWISFPIALFFSILSFKASKRYNVQKVFLTNQFINDSKLENNSSEPIFEEYSKTILPQVCPICKSPNSKKLKVCEYCGNPTI